MNELKELRGLVASRSGGIALGTVTEVMAKGRVVVRLSAQSYRKAYGDAGLGDRVLLRNDQILRILAQESEKKMYIV